MELVVEALSPKYNLDPHLVEHVPQIIFRIHPGGHRVTEEDEVLNKRRRRLGGFQDLVSKYH